MKEHPRADVSESYAFLRLKNPTQVECICFYICYELDQFKLIGTVFFW